MFRVTGKGNILHKAGNVCKIHIPIFVFVGVSEVSAHLHVPLSEDKHTTRLCFHAEH